MADQAYACDFRFDSCGGYWLYLHKALLSGGDQVRIRFTLISDNRPDSMVVEYCYDYSAD